MSTERKWIVVFALLFAVFALASCGASSSNSGSESGVADVESPLDLPSFVPDASDSTVLGESLGDSLATDQNGRADSQNTSFPVDFEAMLEELGDYQEEAIISFEGSDQYGFPVSFAWRSRRSVMSVPPSTRLDVERIRGEESDEIQSLSLVRDGGTSYLYVPNVGCISGDAGMFRDDISLPFDMAILWKSIAAGDPIGESSAVTGVNTVEYSLVESGAPLGSSGNWTVSGSANIVEGGDFVTRMLVNVLGNGDFLGDGRVLDGEYLVDINITKINEGNAVVIPAACLETFLYPVTSDASDITSIGDLLSYSSRQSITDIVNFYLVEMADAGWQSTMEPEVFDDLAILNFQRDGMSLMVSVDYDAGSETARVFVSP